MKTKKIIFIFFANCTNEREGFAFRFQATSTGRTLSWERLGTRPFRDTSLYFALLRPLPLFK